MNVYVEIDYLTLTAILSSMLGLTKLEDFFEATGAVEKIGLDKP